MEIKNNFKVDKYKITGFEQSEENANKIVMKLEGYLVCEFDKANAYEFLEAMVGKDYLKESGYNKARFEDEYAGKEVAVLRGTLTGQVAFVLKQNSMIDDIIGLTGVDEFDNLIAKDTNELFKDFDELREENVETL